MDARIVEILQGYARADDFLERERMQRLAKMSTEDSRAIFNNLVAFWLASPTRNTISTDLQDWRLENKLKVRRAFVRLAEAKGYL